MKTTTTSPDDAPTTGAKKTPPAAKAASKAAPTTGDETKKRRRRKKGDSSRVVTTVGDRSHGFTEAGYAALRIAETANPEKTRQAILSEALMLYVGDLSHSTILRCRRVSTEDLSLLAQIGCDAEDALTRLHKNLILAKGDQVKRNQLLPKIDHELKNLRQMRQTICNLIGIPPNTDYPDDAKFLINMLKKDLPEKRETLQGTYQTGITMLSAFTFEDE